MREVTWFGILQKEIHPMYIFYTGRVQCLKNARCKYIKYSLPRLHFNSATALCYNENIKIPLYFTSCSISYPSGVICFQFLSPYQRIIFGAPWPKPCLLNSRPVLPLRAEQTGDQRNFHQWWPCPLSGLGHHLRPGSPAGLVPVAHYDSESWK